MGPGPYAARTHVAADRSRAEIERILTRYGATGFIYGWEGPRAIIAFRMHDRHVKFLLPMPDKADVSRTPQGRTRRGGALDLAHQQEVRRRWRALTLAVKAKLEVVASGIVGFDDEFLPYIVMPDGKTVAEHVGPMIADAYATGKVKALLPHF